MNILDQAIAAAGGVSALARALNTEPNVVSNWRMRGTPAGWTAALILMRTHRDGVFSHVTNVSEMDSNVSAAAHTA
jgi:hypothetical protein